MGKKYKRFNKKKQQHLKMRKKKSISRFLQEKINILNQLVAVPTYSLFALHIFTNISAFNVRLGTYIYLPIEQKGRNCIKCGELSIRRDCSVVLWGCVIFLCTPLISPSIQYAMLKVYAGKDQVFSERRFYIFTGKERSFCRFVEFKFYLLGSAFFIFIS